MMKLLTLGQCVIQLPSGRIAPDAERLFAFALYLAVERGRRVERSALVAMFWPELDAERGGHCLRTATYRLRALDAPVESDRSHVWIPAEAVDADFLVLETPAASDVESVAAAADGPF